MRDAPEPAPRPLCPRNPGAHAARRLPPLRRCRAQCPSPSAGPRAPCDGCDRGEATTAGGLGWHGGACERRVIGIVCVQLERCPAATQGSVVAVVDEVVTPLLRDAAPSVRDNAAGALARALVAHRGSLPEQQLLQVPPAVLTRAYPPPPPRANPGRTPAPHDRVSAPSRHSGGSGRWPAGGATAW